MILSVSCAMIVGCSVKKMKCSDFKTGTFKYTDSNSLEWIVIRSDSFQTEFNKTNNLKIKGKINWLSECSYSLTYIEVNNNLNDTILGTKIKVDIVDLHKNSYTYIVKYKNFKPFSNSVYKL